MILTAHCDESGTHAGSPVSVLAGFVGSTEDWISFDREWAKVLKKHGVTHVRAKQLWHRQGPFKGWTQARAGRLWADLMYVLQENKHIFASKTVLLDEDYKLFYVSDGPARRERLDTRYALCLRALLHFHPVFHRERFTRGSMNFVLEDGHRNAGDALRVVKELRDDPSLPWRDAIGTLTFAPKKQFGALQAADMLAYWAYRIQCALIQGDLYEMMDSADFELDLIQCGITVLDHIITPYDLMNLRQNFLRKKKRPVFGIAQMDHRLFAVGPSSGHVGELPFRPAFGIEPRAIERMNPEIIKHLDPRMLPHLAPERNQ
jgi:hypothetical protein